VVADDVLGDAAYDEGLALRVDTLAPHALAHLQVEPLDEVVDVRSRDAINGHDVPASPRRPARGTLPTPTPSKTAPRQSLWRTRQTRPRRIRRQ
jgi:hypothetical protein